MENQLTKEVASLFESLKHVNENGVEYWSAREIYPYLGYSQWRGFADAIERAKEACKSASQRVEKHFANVRKTSKMPNGGVKEILDVLMTRYACYLVAQNGDPRKTEIAQAQTYFAIQTRYAEIQQMEAYQQLDTEDERRLFLRSEMYKHNSALAAAAKEAGVIEPRDYAIFQNFGYRGLYGGLGAKEIHKRKGLKQNQKILDHMGSTELAANLFRTTQAEEKLKRDNIHGKANANRTHYEVGQKVRKAIADIGGIMPEDLPTPKESIQSVEAKRRNSLKQQEEQPLIDEQSQKSKEKNP